MNRPKANYQMASLYVGDLRRDVTEHDLYKKFSPVGGIFSVKLCRDSRTGKSRGYGYVNFKQAADAERALHLMKFEKINGHPVRIMVSHRDPSLRKSGVGNVFIKGLEKTIDSRSLYDVFSTFGKIINCRVVSNERGSKGYGYVQFEEEEAAERAIQRLNGLLFDDKKVFVGHFKSRKERKDEASHARTSEHESRIKEDRKSHYKVSPELLQTRH